VFHSLRRVAKAVVLVLLAWTALDLAYPQCCLSERLGRDAAHMSATDPGSALPDQGDLDDCFCCARCLDTGARIPRFDIATAAPDFDEPVHHPVTRPSTLDHPPQNA
jgi:hypothetical protein